MRRLTLKHLFVVCLVNLWIMGFSSSGMADQPKYGGTLRVGTFVAHMNFMDARSLTVEWSVPSPFMIYDGLLQWGPKGYEKPEPWLATSYETKDNRVWVFRLRKGVKFHNGRELTANDVKANLDWIIETPKGWKPYARRAAFTDMEKAEIIDKYTVKITLKRPFAPFPRILASEMRAIVPPEEVEKWGDSFGFHPMGTGPFKAVEIKEDKVVLERFDGYWGPKPYLDKVEYVFYRSNESRLIALQKGEVDIAYVFDDAKPTLEKDPNLSYAEIIIRESLNKLYFNVRRWPMNDIRFRRAVWMGADWKNIAINCYPYKSGNPARTLFEHSKYFNPEALKLVPPYNPEEAKRLIGAVEKDDGKKIPPIYWLDTTQTERQALAEMAKIQLAQIGVSLNLQLVSRAIWSDKIQKDPKIEWDIGQMGMGFGAEPYKGLVYYMTNSGYGADGKSLNGYSNPEMDRWIQKAVEAIKEEDRIKCYQEAEKILLMDVASVPLCPTRGLIAYNKKVKGFVPNDLANIIVTRDWANMWIEK
jgi:peptide/nickel transport system substrate-binding protein